MESFTLLCLVVAGHVVAQFELMIAMGERTSVTEFTLSVQLPEFADLSLKLHLEARLGASCVSSSCLSGI